MAGEAARGVALHSEAVCGVRSQSALSAI